MPNPVLRSLVRQRFLWIVLSLTTAATLLFVACGGGGTTASPTATSLPTATSQPTATATATSQPTAAQTATTVKVQIVEKNGQYSFQPATLTIKKGTQVVWTNMSDAPHTVTSDSSAFNTTSNLSQNQTYKFTFATAGTFAYHCNIHPYMKATITVTS